MIYGIDTQVIQYSHAIQIRRGLGNPGKAKCLKDIVVQLSKSQYRVLFLQGIP